MNYICCLMYTLKKSLGQHFLRDENISKTIVASVVEAHEKLSGRAPGERWRLLEVGPGAGAITKYFLERTDLEFRAVELDHEKVEYLQNTWPVLKGRIYHQSVLDLERPFGEADGVAVTNEIAAAGGAEDAANATGIPKVLGGERLSVEKFTVVGNFPYNISTQILFKMLDWKAELESMTGMFQKEVAQRVAAKEGNKVYGVISVLIQAFFTVDYLFEVHEQCFNPPPKVKSAVIRLVPRSELPAFRDEGSFFTLVKTAFNQRRKTLRNAVKSLFDASELEDAVFGQRAEQLTGDDFARLTWKMRPVSKTSR